MKRAHLFAPTRAAHGTSVECLSADYLQSMGYICQVASGIFTHLPMGRKLFENVKTVLHRELEAAGAGLHHFPALHPLSIWERSGRLTQFSETMFRLKDRAGREACLAPTHEILAAGLARTFIRSYRDMPVMISQTQTKFRDEIRPRGGVLRTKEFTMQDLYAYDRDLEGARVSYDKIVSAYRNALVELRVPFLVQQQADMGEIGGVDSHEFHVVASIGEDRVADPVDGREKPSIEIAHTFLLGDQYTSAIGAEYADQDGSVKPIIMCSFGMGIERTAAALLEHSFERGGEFVWPWAIAPYKAVVIAESKSEAAMDLYRELLECNIDVVLDDRPIIRFGEKIKEAIRFGYPLRFVLGKNFKDRAEIEIASPRTRETVFAEPENILSLLPELIDYIKARELAEMTFDVISCDPATRTILVKLDHPNQILHNYCEIREACTDLLGNFDRRTRKLHGDYMLVANGFRVIPIKVDPTSSADVEMIHGIECQIVGRDPAVPSQCGQ